MADQNASNQSRRKWLKTSVAASILSIAGSAKARADLSLESAKDLPKRRRTADSQVKQAARMDYAKSLHVYGGQLHADSRFLFQSECTNKPYQFDVLIVGSGYGASIAAARLSAKMLPGTRIGLLERGREWVPGDFPDTLSHVMRESRFRLLGMNQGEMQNPTGLFNILQCPEMAILSGSGLGGSSLINASVAIRPDREVFMQQQWPRALRDIDFLSNYYDLASYELGVQVEPADWTSKMRSQRLAIERLRDYGLHYEAAALSLTRTLPVAGLPVVNRQGMIQRGCIDCGDCLTGCNVGAKNTLAMNYLPIARRNNTLMFTQTEVRGIEKCHGHWRVHFLYHERAADGNHRSVPGTVTTRILVLGAGSIGSSEILMRSQSGELRFSPKLGYNWTGNGDALGFIRQSKLPTNIAGRSAYDPWGERIGPTIQTNTTTPFVTNLYERTLVQEGVAARSYVNALGLLMRDLDLDQTQVLLGMGHDGQEGRLVLGENGNAYVSWPGLLESDYRRLIRDQFSRIAHGHGGQYKFLRAFGDRMISVHPLGGCGMSDDPRFGVINHRGQVYDMQSGGDIDSQTGEFRVHEGLYVCDGAVLPTAIACNPYLTISALSERAAQLITLDPKYSDLFQWNSPTTPGASVCHRVLARDSR